jgi:hypothetical protein
VAKFSMRQKSAPGGSSPTFLSVSGLMDSAGCADACGSAARQAAARARASTYVFMSEVSMEQAGWERNRRQE